MDIVPILFQLLLVIFLIAMNGFFVAAEFACVKIRPSRLETLIQEGSRQAKYAKKLTDHLDASLSVTQLGITLASLGLGWVGEPAVATLILPITHAIGLDYVIGHTISLALAFSIITGLHIVLGELTPKTMAIQNVEKIMLSVALPMLVFHRVMYPFVWLLNHVANWVAHRMGFHTASEGDDAHTEEEIRLRKLPLCFLQQFIELLSRRFQLQPGRDEIRIEFLPLSDADERGVGVQRLCRVMGCFLVVL